MLVMIVAEFGVYVIKGPGVLGLRGAGVWSIGSSPVLMTLCRLVIVAWLKIKTLCVPGASSPDQSCS